MGSQSLTIHLERRTGASLGDLDDLHRRTWEILSRFVDRYATTAEARAVFQSYWERLPDHPGFATATPEALVFAFFDDDGAVRSQSLCLWWARLALASTSEEVAALASGAGLGIAGPGDTVRDVLLGGGPRFMAARGQLWLVADNGLLIGDGEVLDDLSRAEVTPAERARADGIADGAPTEEPLTGMLLPDDDFAEALVEALGSEEAEVRFTAAWYLGYTAIPPEEAIRGLLHLGADDDEGIARAAQGAIARLAGWADLAEPVRGALDDPRSGVRAAALGAVLPLVQRGLMDEHVALEAVLAELGSPGAAQAVAAETVGYFDLDSARIPQIRDALIALLCSEDLEPEAAHNGVLSLVNLHLAAGEAPEAVLQVLEAQAAATSEHSALARWALARFSR